MCLLHRYSCDCVPGFTGQHCETNINECASNPCANGGVCMDLVDGFKCECPRGYYDARCLSDVDECASSPCKNGGTCEDGVNQFICRCLPGYGGELTCPANCSELVLLASWVTSLSFFFIVSRQTVWTGHWWVWVQPMSTWRHLQGPLECVLLRVFAWLYGCKLWDKRGWLCHKPL
jgi:hypothetical protein